MTFDDHHNDPPRVWCARGMRKPKPGCCWARRLLFDRHSRRPLLVAEKKGLHRLQWMRTLRFMSFFSKRFRALGCPNWAALLMGYFESPCWEIKPGWCHGPAQQVLRTSLEWNLPKASQTYLGDQQTSYIVSSCCPFEDGFGFEDFGKKSQKWYGFICSVFEGPEQTTLSWAFFATCCSLQLQKLPRKWKVIQKLEGRHYRSLQNW